MAVSLISVICHFGADGPDQFQISLYKPSIMSMHEIMAALLIPIVCQCGSDGPDQHQVSLVKESTMAMYEVGGCILRFMEKKAKWKKKDLGRFVCWIGGIKPTTMQSTKVLTLANTALIQLAMIGAMVADLDDDHI